MAAPWIFGTTGPAFRFESIMGPWPWSQRSWPGQRSHACPGSQNILLGLAVAIAAWIFPEMSLAVRLSDLLAGALLMALSVPRGPIKDRYGGWDPLIV